MTTAILLQILIRVVFGVICAAIAGSRGRSAVAWFFLGALFVCISLVLVLVVPDLKVQQEKEEQMRRENRRLRERLRKERMVADRRHEATMARLDVHDEALGLDTGQAAARIAGASDAEEEDPFRAEQPKPGAAVQDDGTEWYYLKGQERVGPIRVTDLHDLWQDGRVDSGTLVWCAAMTDWAAIRTVSNLRRVLGD